MIAGTFLQAACGCSEDSLGIMGLSAECAISALISPPIRMTEPIKYSHNIKITTAPILPYVAL